MGVRKNVKLWIVAMKFIQTVEQQIMLLHVDCSWGVRFWALSLGFQILGFILKTLGREIHHR
jgi:hypothetical protein